MCKEEAHGTGSGVGLCQVGAGWHGVAPKGAGIVWSCLGFTLWEWEGNTEGERVPGNLFLEEKQVGAERKSVS